MNTIRSSKSAATKVITLDWKVVLGRKPLILIILGLLVMGGAWATWSYLRQNPPGWMTRWQVSRYLKKNATPNKFKSEFAFPSKAEMSTAPKDGNNKPGVTKGSRTGKDFDSLAQEYTQMKISALVMEYEIPESEAELKQAKPRLERLKKQLADAQAAGATNRTVLAAQVRGLEQRVVGLEKKATAGPELQKTEAALGPMLADLVDFQKVFDVEAKSPETTSNNKLNSARDQFIGQLQGDLDKATSYGAIYTIIGKQLWVASVLLDSANPEHQRVGLSLALRASRTAMNDAANGWLGARICDGYILPHLDLATDTNRRSQFNLDTLLNECANIYRDNIEQHNVVRAYKMLLAQATTPQRADGARAQIGMAYEQNGELKEALSYYRQIKATNDYRWLTRQVSRLEQQLKNR